MAIHSPRTRRHRRRLARLLPCLLAGVLVLATLGGAAAIRQAPSGAAEDDRSLVDLPIDLGGSRDPLPAPTGVVREFELVAQPARWEILPGVGVDAFAYNGQVPGPTIRLTEGDTLRVTLHNELDEPTSIHWHGLHVPNAMDGVPGVTQDPVEPGASFVYEFVVSHAGTFMYHSHLDAAEQVDRGLYGPLIVDPQPANAGTTRFDREFTMMLSAWNVPAVGPAPAAADDMAGMPGMESAPASDGEAGEPPERLAMPMDYNYFTINGLAYPAAPAWDVSAGDLVRVRVINISNLVHPMHLHGTDFKVVAKDGEPLRPEQQIVMNTLSVNAGETYDVVIRADNPGTWVFHCHELHHTENDGVEPGGLIQVIRYVAGAGAER